MTSDAKGAPLLCKHCDVFVGFHAGGVVRPPVQHSRDAGWLRSHCWVCLRHEDEVRVNPYGLPS